MKIPAVLTVKFLGPPILIVTQPVVEDGEKHSSSVNSQKMAGHHVQKISSFGAMKIPALLTVKLIGPRILLAMQPVVEDGEKGSTSDDSQKMTGPHVQKISLFDAMNIFVPLTVNFNTPLILVAMPLVVGGGEKGTLSHRPRHIMGYNVPLVRKFPAMNILVLFPVNLSGTPLPPAVQPVAEDGRVQPTTSLNFPKIMEQYAQPIRRRNAIPKPVLSTALSNGVPGPIVQLAAGTARGLESQKTSYRIQKAWGKSELKLAPAEVARRTHLMVLSSYDCMTGLMTRLREAV